MAKRIRVILDTNWYISATINKNSRRTLYGILKNKNIVILFSDEIFKEYNQVITRNKFKSIITAHQVTRFMNLVISKVEIIGISTNIEGSRDPKDNFLLSLSNDNNVDYLITGDLDLLILKKIGKTTILLLQDFLTIISHKTL